MKLFAHITQIPNVQNNSSDIGFMYRPNHFHNQWETNIHCCESSLILGVCHKFFHPGDSGSIEQDADIVMFIYRDEYYNPDTTERPNIAELNIAKHRNGPTGSIDLYWHGKLATFRNLQRQEINL